jgi:cytochrome c oxidase assembly protein subunit 15
MVETGRTIVKSPLHRLALFAAIVAFAVIVLGAYVRLSHAGLGCPDWPGCYGQLTWPVEAHDISKAAEAFPDRPVETDKAWKEMVHRYLAGTLVLLVIAINVLCWNKKYRGNGLRSLAGLLLALILFQAALGMWTVTLKLLPLVVMAHLMGGLATFGLLLWLAWRSNPAPDAGSLASYRLPILVGLVVLIAQVALGGWTSANYAALACPDFPSCQGALWPETNFGEGFVLWREIGVDYEGGVLDMQARVAIHMAHRVGALITLLVLGILAARLIRSDTSRQEGLVLGALLVAQIALGIQNVMLQLPLVNAVAHNGMAALLLAVMLWLTYRSALRPATTAPRFS